MVKFLLNSAMQTWACWGERNTVFFLSKGATFSVCSSPTLSSPYSHPVVAWPLQSTLLPHPALGIPLPCHHPRAASGHSNDLDTLGHRHHQASGVQVCYH